MEVKMTLSKKKKKWLFPLRDGVRGKWIDTCKALNASKCSKKNFLNTFLLFEKNIYNTLWVVFRESDLRRYLCIFWRLSEHSSLSLGKKTTEFSGAEGTCPRSPASQRQSFRHQASDFKEALQTVDSRESKGNPLSSLLRSHRSQAFFLFLCINHFSLFLVHWFLRCQCSLLSSTAWPHPIYLIHGPNIPGSYAILLLTASDFTFTTRHIHT